MSTHWGEGVFVKNRRFMTRVQGGQKYEKLLTSFINGPLPNSRIFSLIFPANQPKIHFRNGQFSLSLNSSLELWGFLVKKKTHTHILASTLKLKTQNLKNDTTSEFKGGIPFSFYQITWKQSFPKKMFYVVCHKNWGKILRCMVWSCGKNSLSSFKNHFHTVWFFGSYISKFNKICKVWLEAWKVCSIQEKICQKGKMSHILRSPRNPLRLCRPWQSNCQKPLMENLQ